MNLFFPHSLPHAVLCLLLVWGWLQIYFLGFPKVGCCKGKGKGVRIHYSC